MGEERRREGRSDCGVGEDVEWRIRGRIDNERSEEWESRALRSPFEASEDEPNPTSHRRRRHEGADDRRARSPMTSTPGPAQQVAKWRVAAAHHASCLSCFGVHCSLFPTVISSSPITPDTQFVIRVNTKSILLTSHIETRPQNPHHTFAQRPTTSTSRSCGRARLSTRATYPLRGSALD